MIKDQDSRFIFWLVGLVLTTACLMLLVVTMFHSYSLRWLLLAFLAGAV
ncbi:hypothetical protein [Nesterenkonia pannonica]|nr:hypothetical protein [Nesterenkonia pannonica]